MLDLETIGQEGVTSGGIDDKLRLPFKLLTIITFGTDDCPGIARQKIDRFGLGALMHLNPFFLGVTNQDGVKLSALDLISVRHGFVPSIGKLKGLRHLM